PKPPAVGRNLTPPSAFESEAIAKPPEKRLSRAQRREVWRLKIRIRDRLRRGHTKSVKQMLDDKNLRHLFSDYNMDWSYARLAKGYFMDGRDEWAVQWAEKATKRSGKYLPEAHWTAGLALWRLGQYVRAAEHFEQASILDRSPWTHSASAFWAARAYMVARKPEKVTPLLLRAAEHERTFYGMLAGRLMGREISFNWEIPPLAGDETRKLKGNKGGRRALALLQLGEDALAERELRKVATLVSKDEAEDILAIAANAGMAELAMRLDAMLYPDGGGLDGAVYPVPVWQPEGGFKVDRALIYALVRQESRFNPNAKSGVGARGLMQLMPGTAGFVARDKRYRWSKKSELFDPEHNLALGQRYIQILLNDKKISGDLFLMAAAWNGGPGNLNKWRRRGDDLDDALFFIESLPSRETRIFIERVLTNLWVYRNRLGQPAPSLDAVARGEWPKYQELGQRPLVVADVKN
ncbi:MAG: lytic transglycosylase domain-containing protein, partial [Rhodospirillaceae bacterium]|nr:lytic transglycosylase domain-containing protein [Rhodospirillaceae bacterium]